jgi:hypothetical protein
MFLVTAAAEKANAAVAAEAAAKERSLCRNGDAERTYWYKFF